MIYSRILAPIDGSETAQIGVQEAIKIARDQGAQLLFVYVVDTHVVAMDPYGTVNSGEIIESLRAYGAQVLAKAREDAIAQGVDAQIETTESIAARPGDAIVRCAKTWGADLIVMGTHGRRGVSHLLLGSDAELVVRTSPAPVLLVRRQEAASA